MYVEPNATTADLIERFREMQRYWRDGLIEKHGLLLHKDDEELLLVILDGRPRRCALHGFDLRKFPEPWLGEPIWNEGDRVGLAPILLVGMKPRPPQAENDKDYQAGQAELMLAHTARRPFRPITSDAPKSMGRGWWRRHLAFVHARVAAEVEGLDAEGAWDWLAERLFHADRIGYRANGKPKTPRIWESLRELPTAKKMVRFLNELLDAFPDLPVFEHIGSNNWTDLRRAPARVPYDPEHSCPGSSCSDCPARWRSAAEEIIRRR